MSMTKNATMGAAALLVAAASASAGVDGPFVVSMSQDGWSYETNVAGEFVDSDTYVARLEFADVSGDLGGSGVEFEYIEYRVNGSNLRAGGAVQTVNLNFNVAAGFSNTAFGFSAAPVTFAPFATATGSASATVGLTASSNPLSGAGATFAANGAGAYNANYNSGGSNFADLLAGSYSVPSGSDVFSDNFSGPIFGAVGDIGASWGFTLSALDLASGVSTFSVTPSPASAALLGLGGLVAVRRRR